MAQAGNDNQKDGVVSAYPDNVHAGVTAAGDNFTPLGMATSHDGSPDDRGQTEYSTKWLYEDKPGID